MRKAPAEEAEATARAINAEPWEPMIGMVKRQCPLRLDVVDDRAIEPGRARSDCGTRNQRLLARL
jgi:hypothetical protein